MTAEQGGQDRYDGGKYFDNANPYLESILEPWHRRVLEVGCGAAALGAAWKRRTDPPEVWGIEIDRRAAETAAARIDRVVCADLEQLEVLPEDAGQFDLITFGDVLEHLRDPGRAIELLLPYLGSGGEIAACVPNVGHWSVVVELLRGRFDYADEGLLDRTHVHLFTPATFHELLTAHGLRLNIMEQRIRVPGPVTEPLARLGAALAGDPSRAGDLAVDLETYQMIFRAQRAD